MWNLKYDTNELIYETETDSKDYLILINVFFIEVKLTYNIVLISIIQQSDSFIYILYIYIYI